MILWQQCFSWAEHVSTYRMYYAADLADAGDEGSGAG